MINKKSLAAKLILFTGVTLMLVISTVVVFFVSNSAAMRKEATLLTDMYVTHINGQIIDNITSNAQLVGIFAFNSNLQEYLSNDNPSEQYNAFSEVNLLYTTATGINTDFQDLIIIDKDAQPISVGGKIYDIDKVKNFYSTVKYSQDILVSVYDFSSVFDTNSSNSLVSTCPVYKDIGENRQRIGSLMFVMNLKPVMETMNAIKFTNNSHIFLINNSGAVLCGTIGSEHLLDKGFDTKSLQAGLNTVEIDGTSYMQIISRHEKADFFLLNFVPMNDVYVYSFDYTKNTIILISVIAIAIIGMALYINRSFRKPVQSLLNSMEAVKKGDLSIRSQIIEESEIGMLSISFDDMMNKIQAMTKTIVETQARMYELELTSSRMELRALQNQINPHFLYNTLACIQGIAICNNENEILKITKALSNMYRYILRVPDVVNLREELDNIQNYLLIQKIRLGERLQIKQDVNVTALEQPILKLLLQPLVENAIEHGIGEKVGGGEICLKICHNELLGRLEITISDNGVGMDSTTLAMLKSSLNETLLSGQEHVGTKSVFSRLRLAYHEDFSFEYYSEKGSGTMVFVSLPFVTEDVLFNEKL